MNLQKIYGIHAVNSLLQTQPESISHLYYQEGRNDHRLQEIQDAAKNAGIPQKSVSKKYLASQLGDSARHQGVMIEMSDSPKYHEDDLFTLLEMYSKNAFILVLDGVQDPHNLGACLRSANAMGVHVVLAPKDRAVGITPVVRKVACGAAELTPFIQVTNLSRTLQQLKEAGVWLLGAAGDADMELAEVDLRGPIAVVLGAEGKGLRRLTREHCDFLASIPMLGSVSSLNVSVATGICLYEVISQRREK